MNLLCLCNIKLRYSTSQLPIMIQLHYHASSEGTTVNKASTTYTTLYICLLHSTSVYHILHLGTAFYICLHTLHLSTTVYICLLPSISVYCLLQSTSIYYTTFVYYNLHLSTTLCTCLLHSTPVYYSLHLSTTVYTCPPASPHWPH